MDTWLISDSDRLINHVRDSLRRLDIPCPPSRVLSSSRLIPSADFAGADCGIIIFAVECLSSSDIELLHHIRSQSQASIAVVSYPSDHASVLRVIRAGADDYLNANGDLSEELAGFVARITLKRTQHVNGKLISIVPCHAASDASVLAVNVSASIAKRKGSCCLLDFQLRGGYAALLLNLKPRHTIYDLMTQTQCVDETMLKQALTQHESGVDLLAGPDLFCNLKNIRPQVCQEILSTAQSFHPFVIVISEDVQHSEQLRALADSEHVVLTTRLDLPSLHRTQRHVDFLTRNQVPLEHLHIVAMNTGRSGELPLSEIKTVLRIPTIHCIPDDPLAVNLSMNIGNPMICEAPKSKASKAICRFAEFLAGEHEARDRVTTRPWSFAKSAAAIALNSLSLSK